MLLLLPLPPLMLLLLLRPCCCCCCSGYPLEVHEVVTSDGYLLLMERIPLPAATDVVFMMHGAPRLSTMGGMWGGRRTGRKTGTVCLASVCLSICLTD
jgi:hypothetical protein